MYVLNSYLNLTKPKIVFIYLELMYVLDSYLNLFTNQPLLILNPNGIKFEK